MNMNELKIISEIGSVHDGSFGNAKKLIEASSKSGADIVKFQTHIADAESLPDAPNPNYFNDETRVEYFERTSFSLNQLKSLKEFSEVNNIEFISSPFSLEAVDLLEKVNIFAYKIPSGEITNIPLIEKIASLNKPVFLSSGMSNWDELDSAVKCFNDTSQLWVMQCSSQYPCPPERIGLNVIDEIKKRYNCNLGFSDHSLGFAASIGAVLKGASVIEKHITFSKLMYGSDAQHSMEIDEFVTFCKEVRSAKIMFDNNVDKNDLSIYSDMKQTFQKSIVAAKNILKGETFTISNIAYKKPGDGVPVNQYKKILGCKAARSIKKNKKILFEDIIK